jgi:hypothetical protein
VLPFVTARLHFPTRLFQNILLCSVQLFRYTTKTGSTFYVPVLHSSLAVVASALISFQRTSYCKQTQLYSLPDTRQKKTDKKRYLFTRPTRNGLIRMKICCILCIRLECKPSRIKRLHKMPAKTSVVQPLLFLVVEVCC